MVAVALIAIAFVGALRSAPVPARTPVAAAPRSASADVADTAPALTPVPLGWWTYVAAERQLTLPAAVKGVDLAGIPDRLLNDPPAVRLRVPVHVRGTSGIASVDAPFEIAWTEAGYWYWMRSVDLSVAQLIDLASALR